jgi:Na+/melibiose symporter-like transporter
MKQTDISVGRSVQYSLGNVGTNILFIFISAYLMFFYTNVMGLSGAIAGSIFMVARLIDAFTDPLMGMIVDRTNTKRFGKYRPFLLFATPFMGIFFILTFRAPGMDTGMKIMYSNVTYILYSLAWTAVQTPYLALQIILSRDANKRTRMVAIIQGFGGLSSLCVSAGVIPLLNAFGGQTNPAAWGMVSIILTSVCL